MALPNGRVEVHKPAVLACREMHAHKDIKEMVGEYDPRVPDVSHAMIRIETRRFNHERLEEGARMMDQGIGLKNAARAVRSTSMRNS